MSDEEKSLESEQILCDQCNKHSAFHTLRQLISHMKQTENHQPVCHPCDVTFKNYKQYAGHVKVYHLLKNKNCEIPCEICGKCFLTRNLLKGHYSRVHVVEENLRCNLCRKPYQNIKKLKLHTMKYLIGSPHFAEYHQQETEKLKQANLKKDTESENELETKKYSDEKEKDKNGEGEMIDYGVAHFAEPKLKELEKSDLEENENIKKDKDLQSSVDRVMDDFDQWIKIEDYYSEQEENLQQTGNLLLNKSSISINPDFYVKQEEHCAKKMNPKGRNPTVKVCPFCAAKVKYLDEHIKAQHSDLPSECHECKECLKTFKTKKKLYLHCYAAHRQEPSLCDICSKVFRNSIMLNSHRKQVHEKKPKPPPEQLIVPCPICAKILANTSSWQKHIRLVHGNENIENSPQVSCDECGKMFANEVYMKHHKKSTHHIEPTACDLCNGSYKNKRALQRHKRYAHSGKDKDHTLLKNLSDPTVGTTSSPFQQGAAYHNGQWNPQLCISEGH